MRTIILYFISLCLTATAEMPTWRSDFDNEFADACAKDPTLQLHTVKLPVNDESVTEHLLNLYKLHAHRVSSILPMKEADILLEPGSETAKPARELRVLWKKHYTLGKELEEREAMQAKNPSIEERARSYIHIVKAAQVVEAAGFVAIIDRDSIAYLTDDNERVYIRPIVGDLCENSDTACVQKLVNSGRCLNAQSITKENGTKAYTFLLQVASFLLSREFMYVCKDKYTALQYGLRAAALGYQHDFNFLPDNGKRGRVLEEANIDLGSILGAQPSTSTDASKSNLFSKYEAEAEKSPILKALMQYVMQGAAPYGDFKALLKLLHNAGKGIVRSRSTSSSRKSSPKSRSSSRGSDSGARGRRRHSRRASRSGSRSHSRSASSSGSRSHSRSASSSSRRSAERASRSPSTEREFGNNRSRRSSHSQNSL